MAMADISYNPTHTDRHADRVNEDQDLPTGYPSMEIVNNTPDGSWPICHNQAFLLWIKYDRSDGSCGKKHNHRSATQFPRLEASGTTIPPLNLEAQAHKLRPIKKPIKDLANTHKAHQVTSTFPQPHDSLICAHGMGMAEQYNVAIGNLPKPATTRIIRSQSL